MRPYGMYDNRMKNTSTKTIHPQLKDGFTMRPARLDDMETVVELDNDFSEATIGVRDNSVEDLLTEWGAPGFCLETDNRLVFSPERRLAAYMEVDAIHQPPVNPLVWGRVHPDFEGQGIGTFLMGWGEERARQFIDQVPPDARVAMRAVTVNTVTAAQQLFYDLGLRPTRHYFTMRAEFDQPPPPPKWPEGISIRNYQPEQEVGRVYGVYNETWRDHFGYVPRPFEAGLERFRHYHLNEEGYDSSLWFLALEGEEIAGFAIGRKWDHESKEQGLVSLLGVRRPWRRRGLGLALLRQLLGEYYRRGQTTVSLSVDAGSLTGATRLYEKAGMTVYRQSDLYEKELRPGKDLSIVELTE